MNLVGTTVCVLQRVKAKLFTRVPVAQCGFPSVWSRSLGCGESVQIKAGGGHVALLDFNSFASEVADQLLVDPLWGNSFSVTYMVTCHSKSMACTSLWFCKQEAWVSETINTLPESPTNSDCWTQAVWPKSYPEMSPSLEFNIVRPNSLGTCRGKQPVWFFQEKTIL